MMGEAKRKAQSDSSKRELINRLQSLSLAPASSLRCVHMVVIDLKHVANARDAIGKLPQLIEQFLIDASSQTEGTGLFWALWPSGRQEIHLVRSTEQLREKLGGEYLNIAMRGFSLSLCAFPGEGWKEALRAAHDQFEAVAIKADIAASNAPGVELIQSTTGQNLIAIPEMQDDAQLEGVAARTLRILDDLVANEAALKRHYASLAFSFDGLNDDPREVWDIEPCKKFLKLLHACAPWWMWLAQPTQYIVWLGALASTGPAVVNASMQVAYPLDAGVISALRINGAHDCLDLAQAAGMAPTSQYVQDSIAQAIYSLDRMAGLVSQRMIEIEAGKVGKASESEVRSFHINHPGGSQLDTQTAGPYTLVIDRSERGLCELDRMMEGSRRVPSTAMRGALLDWKNSASPIAVIRAGVHTQTDWSITPVDNDEGELRTLIADMIGHSIDNKASFAWTLSVDSPLMHQLEVLAKQLTVELMTKRGLRPLQLPDDFSHQQQHSGLLDLATDPGGIEVNFGNVQITDAAVFAKVAQLGMSDLINKIASIKAGDASELDLDADDEGLRAWRRDDGSLLVRETTPAPQEVVAPAGSWRLLSDEELAKVERESAEKLKAVDSDILQLLADSLNSDVEKAAQRAHAWNAVKDKATSIAALFGKQSQSLLSMQTFLAGKYDAVELSERWLASDAAYFIFWRHHEGRAACIIAHDEDELLTVALSSVLDAGDSPGTTLLLSATHTLVDARAIDWWRENGGAVVKD